MSKAVSPHGCSSDGIHQIETLSRGRPIGDAVNETPFTPPPRLIPLHGDTLTSQTSAPASASTPAHNPSHFSALAPPDTEVDESEFPFVPWDGSHTVDSRRRLLHWRRQATNRPTEVHVATSDFCRSVFFFCRFSPRFTSRGKCEQDDYSFGLTFFQASSPTKTRTGAHGRSWCLVQSSTKDLSNHFGFDSAKRYPL